MTTASDVPDDRSRGFTVIIEGFFAFMWFGWGQAEAPSWLTVPLVVGSALGVLAVLAGVVTAVRSTGQRTLMQERTVRVRYNTIVGVEFCLIGVGAGVLGATGSAQWIPVWVCAVVGVHFLPLARVFGGLLLVPLAITLLVVAAAALVVGLVSDVAPSTVAGPGTGACLLVVASATLASGSGWRRSGATPPSVEPSGDQPASSSSRRW